VHGNNDPHDPVGWIDRTIIRFSDTGLTRIAGGDEFRQFRNIPLQGGFGSVAENFSGSVRNDQTA